MWDKQYYQELDWNKTGNIDIKVTNHDGGTSYIRMRMAPKNLTNAILELNMALKNLKYSVKCRGLKVGDKGLMYGIGYKNKCEEFVLSKRNAILHPII